jgi:hypothetical protein
MAPSGTPTSRSVLISYERIDTWFLIALGLWVLALIPFAVLGARQPVMALRQVHLPERQLRELAITGVVPMVSLVALATFNVWFSVFQLTHRTVDAPGLAGYASIALALVALVAAVSWARGLRAFRRPAHA